MFKIEFYCEDKNLGEAFKRLSGIAMDVTHAYVPNLEKKADGKIYQTAVDSVDMLTKELHKQKLTEIMGPQMKEIVSKVGLNPASAAHYTQHLITAGVLKKGKKIRNTMQYIVTGK
jgi:hypothetical protein